MGASLLAESLWNLVKQPLGFEPEHLLTVRVLLPWDTRPEAVGNFYDDVQQRIENLPGVEAAGQISSRHLSRKLCLEESRSGLEAGLEHGIELGQS